jgi:hypothetical protein
MRSGWASGAIVGLTMWLAGCGGATSDEPAMQGMDPIDGIRLLAALPLRCSEGRALSLRLPCKIGLNLVGAAADAGYHVTECQLQQTGDIPAVSFMLPLVELPALLHRPVTLPFDALSPPPAPEVRLDGHRYIGALSADATFGYVDLENRAFIASLEEASIEWLSNDGPRIECVAEGSSFWAIAGTFL